MARVRRQRPEPERFWIRYTPTRWPAAEGWWVDLARGRLGSPGPESSPGRLEGTGDDLLYLPPVRPSCVSVRDRAVEAQLAAGGAVLAQRRPGEPSPPAGTVVVDLLQPLLAEDREALAATGGAEVAVWPLIPGISDRPTVWRRTLPLLREAGLRHLLPLAPGLTPRQCRALARDRGEEVWAALFHGPPPDDRAFSRSVAEHGLSPFWKRPPLAAASEVRRRNRELAGTLGRLGDLWLRVGRPESQGQDLLRAARGVEEEGRDLAALHRDGNLSVIPWLDPLSLEVVGEVLSAGRSALDEELERAYLSDDRRGPR